MNDTGEASASAVGCRPGFLLIALFTRVFVSSMTQQRSRGEGLTNGKKIVRLNIECRFTSFTRTLVLTPVLISHEQCVYREYSYLASLALVNLVNVLPIPHNLR